MVEGLENHWDQSIKLLSSGPCSSIRICPSPVPTLCSKLADYPAMSFIFVRWQQIKIQMQTSWVGRSTRGSHYQLYYPSDRVLVLFVKVTYYAVQDHIQPCQLYNCATYCHTKNKCRETIGKIFFFNIILLIWFFVLRKIRLIGKFLSDIKMINFYFLKSRSLEVVEKGYND